MYMIQMYVCSIGNLIIYYLISGTTTIQLLQTTLSETGAINYGKKNIETRLCKSRSDQQIIFFYKAFKVFFGTFLGGGPYLL